MGSPNSPLGKVTTTRRLTVRASDLTAGQLRAFLAGAKGEDKVSVSEDSPDRPGEITTVTVSITSEEELSDE